MRFTVQHPYPLSAEAFWSEMLFDPEYNQHLYCDGLGFGSFTVDAEERNAEGQVVSRRARVRPTLRAPAPVAKLLGDALTYEERGHRDAQGRWVTEIVPSRLADRITLQTTMWTEPTGPDACTRFAAFEVSVRILGLGGMVEKFIEGTLRETYGKAAVFSAMWLAERSAR